MRKDGKQPTRARRYLRLGIIAFVIAGLLLLARTLYVVFADPMQAFLTPAPAATATPAATFTPVPAATPRATAQFNTPPTLSPTPTPEPTPTPTPMYAEFMQNRVNILLVGYDKSPEREVEENDVFRDETNDFRSDVLMLLTVDFARKEAHLISVPRDSYAPIYKENGELYSKRGKWKINAAFAKGGSATKRGFQYAMQTVGKLLGVPIDYYAGVDMDGLKGVVNAMGGVYYDVDVEIRLNGRRLKTGYQHLNGQQVLDYVRARKGISTDAGRNDRQQRMLFAIFGQLQSRDQLKNFPKIYRSMKQYVTTNLNAEQIAAMAAFGMQLSMEDIHRHTLVGEYNSDTPYSSANYYLIDNEALVALIQEVFKITISPNPRYDMRYVLSDIAAEEAKDDIRDAEYLLARKKVRDAFPEDSEGNMLSSSPALLALKAQMEFLRVRCTRAQDADLDIPLNITAIRSGQASLYNCMRILSLEVGLTQRDVSSSRLPKVVFDALPEREPEPAPTAAANA